jgi:uncharacterized damage-inducible protein DinB
MSWKARTCAALAGALLVGASGADGQTSSWHEVQVEDIRTMHSKFRDLAEAFDEAQYDWRPMDGVRSVRGVLGLAIAEAHLFPTGWGYDAPPSSEPGFAAEMERAAQLSKSEMIDDLDTAFAFLIDVVEGMSDEERMSAGEYFGTPMPVHASVATAMNDMHEHLGQLIAYARTNQVVPPWSRGND